MLKQEIAYEIYTFIETESRNVKAPIPDCHRSKITNFLRKHIDVLPDELFRLLEKLGKKSFEMHMAFNHLFNSKKTQLKMREEKQSDEALSLQNNKTDIAEQDFEVSKTELSSALELLKSFKIEVESDVEIIPELHLHACEYSDESSRDVTRQIEVIDLHIKSLEKQKERFKNAVDNDNALICYEDHMNSPTALYVGDKIMTKYGDTGVVLSVDNEKSRFTFDKNGTEETLCSSRLSGIVEYSKKA